MKCPVCHTVSESRVCPGCGQNLEAEYALLKASARFYNEGLEYARQGRLRPAREALLRAVRYNRDNLPARNLLGLVYMQTGEIGDAVIQWTYSAAIQPEASANPAVDYLKRSSRTSGKAGQLKESVRLYNQALELLRNDNMDTALLHLKKAVAQSENYVRARQLLALCCIETHRFARAEELLKETERIDPLDPSQPYLQKLLDEQRQEWENGKREEEGEIRTVPEPAPEAGSELGALLGQKQKRSLKTYLRQNVSAVQCLLFFSGLLVGIMFMALLFTPQKLSQLRQERNEMASQLYGLQKEQDQESERLNALQEELALAKDSAAKIQEQYDTYENNVSALLKAVQYYHEGQTQAMLSQLDRVRPESLNGEQKAVYEWLKGSQE